MKLVTFSLFLFIAGHLCVDPNQQRTRLGLSPYFKTKHVSNDPQFNQQMHSPGGTSAGLQPAYNSFMRTPFQAQPDRANPADTKDWRHQLSTRTGNSMILDSRNNVKNTLTQSRFQGYNNNGQAIYESDNTMPIAKGKFKPNQRQWTLTNNPPVQQQKVRFAVGPNGKVNHFESPQSVLSLQPPANRPASPPIPMPGRVGNGNGLNLNRQGSSSGSSSGSSFGTATRPRSNSWTGGSSSFRTGNQQGNTNRRFSVGGRRS